MADVPLNPVILILDSIEVGTSNPLPLTSAAGVTATLIINPRTLVVNGAEVSASNPLPVIPV